MTKLKEVTLSLENFEHGYFTSLAKRVPGVPVVMSMALKFMSMYPDRPIWEHIPRAEYDVITGACRAVLEDAWCFHPCYRDQTGAAKGYDNATIPNIRLLVQVMCERCVHAPTMDRPIEVLTAWASVSLKSK